MTLLGPDISSFQAGLDLTKLTDASYVLIKATEGDSYVNPYYKGWIKQAAQLGKPTAWYHFLSSDASPAAQAAHAKAVVGTSLPGMLDVEPTTASVPTWVMLLETCRAMIAEGLRLRMVYLPKWFWQQLGSPDLTELSTLGIVLVSSNYPGGSGSATAQYNAGGGDHGPGWAPYGGVVPTFWQFTDSAKAGGQLVDYSAFRGTPTQLAQLFGQPASDPGPTTTTEQLQQGATGALVRTLQGLLNVHGGFNLATDGSFGPKTTQAVRAYQYAHALTVDGVVGNQTWGALNTAKRGLPYPGQQAVGSTGTSVREIQQELAYRGFSISVDGQFGNQTKEIVISYQSLRGLAKDGIIGSLTWGDLFH